MKRLKECLWEIEQHRQFHNLYIVRYQETVCNYLECFVRLYSFACKRVESKSVITVPSVSIRNAVVLSLHSSHASRATHLSPYKWLDTPQI